MGGALAGAVIGLLVLVAGVTGAAAIALIVSVLALLFGCVDYVRRHG